MPTVGAMTGDDKDSARYAWSVNDGSPEADAAIGMGALVFPATHGWIANLWVPPATSDTVRRRGTHCGSPSGPSALSASISSSCSAVDVARAAVEKGSSTVCTPAARKRSASWCV